ncbi:MAG: hypothetical protein HRU15_13375, partial [Planctomycetes bacterium]|nr:hypothetical protein [Planctomycetota bacterium]
MSEVEKKSEEVVLEFDDVAVNYETDHGTVYAVRGVSYKVHADEILAGVGESGCGKSQSSYAAMGLIQEPGKVVRGKINFHEGEGKAP